MSSWNRFAELWTDYLEGELDERGVSELRSLLADDEQLVARAADLFQTHRLVGLVVADQPARQEEFVRQTLALLPSAQDDFVSQVMSQVRPSSDPAPPTPQTADRVFPRRIALAAVLLLAGLTIVTLLPRPWTDLGSDEPLRSGQASIGELPAQRQVRLASSAHAKFFGELSPPVGAVLAPQREFILMSGLVELAFPAGASAILEGPAVFRVLSHESLALDVGHCSVHAPDGAEGFRVETPAMRVVDRGTRFTVSVTETSETEVQVVEGIADVYAVAAGSEPAAGATAQVRMTDGQARRFATADEFAAGAVPFDAGVYRRELPDRIISYEATTASDGGAENLISVTVQRGGRVIRYPIEAIVPSRIISFNASAPRAFLCGPAAIAGGRAGLASDPSLVSGVINPGGSRLPLTSDPVLTDEGGTPGMAVRFARPLVNGPGADVVLFDLQTFANPPDGDAFHISPLVFRDGLKSHTIHRYDLTMESPEARDLTNFHVHFFKEPVDSLDRLESLECAGQQQSIAFRGLAVGIDLSDLGYAEGETIDGLFLQDALDDAHRIDPVFIGGLPEMK